MIQWRSRPNGLKKCSVRNRFMRSNTTWSVLTLLIAGAALGFAQDRQQARQRIDVQGYTIDARVDPREQTLSATGQVTFLPIDETSTVSFELNNSLNLTRVTDEEGHQVPASRLQQDMSVRLSFPQPL